MTLVVLQKVRGMLVPADEESERFVSVIRPGDGIEVDARVRRNVKFHRKFFALLRLVYDSWEPPRQIDERFSPIKSFEAFRKDVLVLAGHCEATFSVDGAVKLHAKSISFADLGEEGFADLYPRVLDVVWNQIMRHIRYRSVDDIDRVVDRSIGFE